MDQLHWVKRDDKIYGKVLAAVGPYEDYRIVIDEGTSSYAVYYLTGDNNLSQGRFELFAEVDNLDAAKHAAQQNETHIAEYEASLPYEEVDS